MKIKLPLNDEQVQRYNSPSQLARVLTEKWVDDNAYCPNCGNSEIMKYSNNKPVADFYCINCKDDYELKSKKDTFGNIVSDGAYHSMIERLKSNSSPNFFLLNYDLMNYEVIHFIVIPKHYFDPSMIEMRNPLASTARRAGWVGCNVVLSQIPEKGKIFIIQNKNIIPKEKVLEDWNKTSFLRDVNKSARKGWLLDVMLCVDLIGRAEFSLNDVYQFEDRLKQNHPDNNNIQAKIRQQLQYLRNMGYIEFISPGIYKLK